MKRLIGLLLCVCMLAAGWNVAFAEEGSPFELRNGIHFGDTIDEIVEKETTLTRTSEDSNSFDGRIAGYDNAECTFTFDDNGGLEDMHYAFGTEVCDSRDALEDVYKTLGQSLIRKYGSPIGNTGGSCELITGSAMSNMGLIVGLIGTMDGFDGDYIDYDEWIVDAENGHVKIDLVGYYYRDSDYDYYYYVDLSYKFYTDEEYDAAVQEKQAEREEVDNDL